jgi:acyl-CoA thioesterase
VTEDEVSFPLKDFLGFTVSRGEGRAVVSLSLGDAHMNPNGVAHGATPFTMMDTAMGAAVMSIVDEGQTCATIELHIRFHRAASDGQLTAEAKVLTAGKRVVHLEAKTTDEQGRLVASATASFAIMTWTK